MTDKNLSGSTAPLLQPSFHRCSSQWNEMNLLPSHVCLDRSPSFPNPNYAIQYPLDVIETLGNLPSVCLDPNSCTVPKAPYESQSSCRLFSPSRCASSLSLPILGSPSVCSTAFPSSEPTAVSNDSPTARKNMLNVPRFVDDVRKGASEEVCCSEIRKRGPAEENAENILWEEAKNICQNNRTTFSAGWGSNHKRLHREEGPNREENFRRSEGNSWLAFFQFHKQEGFKQPDGCNRSFEDPRRLLQGCVYPSKGLSQGERVDHQGDLEEILDILMEGTEEGSYAPVSSSLCNLASIKSNKYPVPCESEQSTTSMCSKCSIFQAQTPSIVREHSSLPGKLLNDSQFPFKKSDNATANHRLNWNWGGTTTRIQSEQYYPYFIESYLEAGQLEKENSVIPKEKPEVPSLSSASESGASLKNFTLPTWTRPTFLGIQSALAVRSHAATAGSPLTPGSSLSFSEVFDEEMSRQRAGSPVREARASNQQAQYTLSAPSMKADQIVSDEEQKMREFWKKLQKRTVTEPKHTLKIRSEGDTVDDGYRWRKYGQKIIKNSPHPRSYYRCTSSRCPVKKQVERSAMEDPTILLITYEGIHLHHRPNPISSSLLAQMMEQGTARNSDQHASSASKLFMDFLPQKPVRNLFDHLMLQSTAPKFQQTEELIQSASLVTRPRTDEGLLQDLVPASRGSVRAHNSVLLL